LPGAGTGFPSTVRVEVSRPLDGEGVEVLDGLARSRITFVLPGGMEAGKSVTRAYAKT